MAVDRTFIQDLFHRLESGDAQSFFANLADDVQWTVKGFFPWARTYTSKEDFLKNAVGIMNKALKEGLKFKVKNLMIDGDIVVAEMDSSSILWDGRPYKNYYCWVIRFEGRLIKEVRAYLDTALLQETLLTVP